MFFYTGADPDFTLTVWNWQQEAILLRCKSFSQEVSHVSFNRDLRGLLTTAGVGHIKYGWLSIFLCRSVSVFSGHIKYGCLSVSVCFCFSVCQ